MDSYVWLVGKFTKRNKQRLRDMVTVNRVPYTECSDLKDMVKNLHNGKLPFFFCTTAVFRKKRQNPLLH